MPSKSCSASRIRTAIATLRRRTQVVQHRFPSRPPTSSQQSIPGCRVLWKHWRHPPRHPPWPPARPPTRLRNRTQCSSAPRWYVLRSADHFQMARVIICHAHLLAGTRRRRDRCSRGYAPRHLIGARLTVALHAIAVVRADAAGEPEWEYLHCLQVSLQRSFALMSAAGDLPDLSL